MIIYSKTDDVAPGAIGKIETPIKMIIEHESDLQKKQGGICDWLFNIEKSNRFGETIISQSGFDIFKATAEGEAAETDCVYETYSKFIEHVQYMKEFVITAEMMEDAHFGIGADAKRRAESFTRAYYKTMNKLATAALANGHKSSMSFAGTTIDLTTGDDYPLFASKHKYGATGSSQSNYFYGDIFSSGEAGSRVYSSDLFEEKLALLSMKLRNMKDENGEPLGYTADTIILPGNRPFAESIVKRTCGSYVSASAPGQINTQYGNWNVVIMPSWQTTDDRIMIMSSEANRNLAGNMFFNRVPLTISSFIDHHTGNYVFNGRCRFGVGFGTYKHILLAVDSATQVDSATAV